MLRLRPTYEELIKETMTHRLKILPERQKRTQQGLLLDDVDFDDFDLSRYDRKELLMNNPDKGTQTDVFNETPSITESESMKTPEEAVKEQIEEEAESIHSDEREPERETERERTQKKSLMRRFYDGLFGEDEFREEREELRNRREQIEDDDVESETPIEQQKSEESDKSLPMNVKKSYENSSSSSSRRSALLPIEEEALSEHIHSSPPVSVQSSIESNRTIEYVEEATPPQSVISSRRSQETIEYIRSRSSRGSVHSVL